MRGFQFPDGSGITNIECRNGQWVHTKTGLSKTPDCAREQKPQKNAEFFVSNFFFQLLVRPPAKTEVSALVSMSVSALRCSAETIVNIVSKQIILQNINMITFLLSYLKNF